LLGDINADGFADVAWGLWGDGGFAGRVIVVGGSPQRFETIDLAAASPDVEEPLRLRITGSHADFGSELAAVGDTDGDGHEDLIVANSPSSAIGALYLVRLNPDLGGSYSVEDLVFDGLATEFTFHGRERALTFRLARAGDVDRDGFADFVIGDWHSDFILEGRAFIVFGRPEFPELMDFFEDELPERVVEIAGPYGEAFTGSAVGPAGDWNGDGYDDVIVGAQKPAILGGGFVSVIFGGPNLPARLEQADLREHGTRIDGTEDLTLIRGGAERAGDVNGDGIDDFAFLEAPALLGTKGAVYVVYGLSRNVAFRRGDATFDGTLDISDAIFVLAYLFLGGEAPRCEDGADIDDDGAHLITDAVYLLGHLFLGGEAPPPPFAAPGPDPTEDALDCAGF
jgi:hypothetical protein